MATKQQQISQERYEIILSRYLNYLECLNDITKDPVTVFDPMCQRSLDELELIREVSRTLQVNKDEDLKKAEQAATLAAEEAAKKAAEEAESKEAEEAAKKASEEAESKETEIAESKEAEVKENQ